uniref:non-specific serine/threonine protein kinase n=1 Tax=Nelumbo nucifera TaxID=4432 RepID=A0A822YT56_NELNU|nr:TPA_asm: hypothetical protein HUJ06_004925 [Nelumbo nucifera]
MKLFPLFFLILQLHANLTFSLSPDGLSLLALKSAVDQTSHASAFSNWNEQDNDPCNWSGISCINVTGFSDPRVVGISLSGLNLQGYIPSELGTLVFLRRLNLHGNRFYGSIPLQLFNATSLRSIFLYGSIPRDLGKCRQLQRLVLASNKFSGEIPDGIWPKLENLVKLDLSSNEFNGTIPADLGDLKSLSRTLNLSFNHFSGVIPASLGRLPVTVSFDLRHNNLTGEIPQTGTFANQGPTAFLDNPSLCGFPLRKPCSGNPQKNTSVNQNPTAVFDTNPKKGLKASLIILIVVSYAAGVAVVGLLIVYVYWKRKDSKSCSCTSKGKLGGGGEGKKLFSCSCWNAFLSNYDSELESDEKAGGNEGGEGGLVAIDKGFTFELDELLRSSAYVLGKSGLGIVYKVVLGNGIPVAVRRLGEGGGQKYKEFAAEIQAIGRVKHPNIVRLRAYYWVSDEKLLISDFISNGNLASALRGRSGQPTGSLSWSNRLKIAKGTARGLAYLHECSPRKFVHGDIKPSNILLDADFHPYISDFGLNRLTSITGNDPSSSGGGGLMGGALPYIKPSQTERSNNSYRAPEARVPGSRPGQKWDVYSFGVVLLEMLTGKSPEFPSSTTLTGPDVPDLVRWVRKGFEEESPLAQMADPMLLKEVLAKKEVLAVFHVALACTEADPEVRPRMKTVSENLDRIRT